MRLMGRRAQVPAADADPVPATVHGARGRSFATYLWIVGELAVPLAPEWVVY